MIAGLHVDRRADLRNGTPMSSSTLPAAGRADQADPNRWVALVVLSSSLFIIVLDNTILNVAVPTIVREFHTNVSSLQWVISGYSLVFASLLISFGRLGDIFGRRRLFFAGAAMFAVGSLIASLSHSVVQLLLGESLLEGIGAAAMLPATLSIISATFQGRERGRAFAVWGAVAGGAGALGPFLGGVLTTNYSWRWAFRINVLVAPLAILAGLRFVRDSRDERAKGIDAPGVVVVTVGLLALVFGIIEASRYGWWTAISRTRILGLSPVPWSLLIAAVMLIGFVVLERRRAGGGLPVVFDFGDLVHRGFRYGLVNTIVLAMGEFGAFFVIPIFLQAGLHFTAIKTGTWLLPAGGAVLVGARVAGLLSARYGPKYVITAGLALEALGIGLYAAAFSSTTTLWSLLPGLIAHGVGIGFATSQLTSVVLSDIPPAKAGSASGAAGMVRQVGTSLGIALIGAVFATRSASSIRSGLRSIPGLAGQAADAVVAGASGFGSSAGPTGADPRIAKVVSSGIIDGSRLAVLLACAIVAAGALLSTLVPNIPPDAGHRLGR